MARLEVNWTAPKDSANTEGLCGYMDGNQENDLTTRTGRIIPLDKNNHYYKPTEFTRSWRLKKDENLFTSLNDKKLKRWGNINAMYCVCEQAIQTNISVTSKRVAKALCSPTQYLDCELTNPTLTSRMCNIISRKKRSTRNVKKVVHGRYKHRRESDRLLKLINAPEKENHLVQRRGAAVQNVSESEARGHCGHVVNNSHVVSELSDSIPGGGVDAVLEQCIFEVMVGNDLSLADVHVDAMNTVAQATLIRDPVYTANNTDKVEVFIKNSCPGNCSQNGKCSDQGDCECDDHYKGADCSIDERDPVTIDDLEGGGLCNLTDGDGCNCFFVRTAYLLPNFTCAISGVITYIDGTEENITETANAGEYENIFTGQCCAPEERNKRSTSQNIVFSTRYDIAISNDGNHFGSAEPLHVFDSECQDALPDSKNGHHIVLKVTHL
ncbi:von Willebrand factor D and EGF domain-containing protein-like [Mercenaria mercenaria]|uniref:von Willebrand factor D and EGF domain-containing protein-like n=1 Tax=Mercenaria mercenaria TaxID=6596 RepID=UPI00234EE924|nr:von Willebrand factor D and EGF domain-containing protein-like [Mercenaria mercenaria]